MRRIFTIILIALSLLALWSCDIFGTEHTHEFGEWNVIKEASCTEDGCRTRSCSCGESETESVSATGHTEEIIAAYPATCTEKGLTEGKKCTVCGETTVEQEEILVLKHDYKYTEVIDENNNIVTLVVCQRKNCGHTSTSTAGLYDAENKLLASWYELKNVYWLNNFKTTLENNENLKSGTKLIIDDNTTSIQVMFQDCTTLTDIVISKSVTYMDPYTFWGCSSLINITVEDENECFKSVDGVLYNKEMNYLLKYPAAKEGSDFSIPDSVGYIDALAFSDNLSLINITIPNSVTKIGNSAFYDCVSLKNIYFTGTIVEWNEIPNIRLWLPNNALVHCDDQRMFITRGFAGNFGSSGSTAIVYIEVNDNNIYLDKILYDVVYKDENTIIEYDDYIYSYIDTHQEPEKIAVLEQIKACDELYVLEGIDQHGSLQKRICCYIDSTFYILTISNINEDTGAILINRICYSIIEWEE